NPTQRGSRGEPGPTRSVGTSRSSLREDCVVSRSETRPSDVRGAKPAQRGPAAQVALRSAKTAWFRGPKPDPARFAGRNRPNEVRRHKSLFAPRRLRGFAKRNPTQRCSRGETGSTRSGGTSRSTLREDSVVSRTETRPSEVRGAKPAQRGPSAQVALRSAKIAWFREAKPDPAMFAGRNRLNEVRRHKSLYAPRRQRGFADRNPTQRGSRGETGPTRSVGTSRSSLRED